MKRLALAFSLLLGTIGVTTPTVVHATEINTDVGCDSAGAWMPETGWALSGSKCVATSATRMKMLMQMNPLIKRNHNYKMTFTVSGVSGSGILRAFAGVKMPSAPTGINVTTASVAAIADNFTTSLGVQSGSHNMTVAGPGAEADRNGSTRLTCLSGGFLRVDPLVYPNLQAPHLHELVGATNMGEAWTYTDFRTKAQSSCNNMTDPTHTINRSGYWFPAVINGNGDPVRTQPILLYYKGSPDPALPASVNITAAISGTVMTVSAVTVAGSVEPGEFITGTGVTAGTYIVTYGTGTGGTGTYNINNSQTVGSSTLTLKSPYLYSFPVEAAANPSATMCADASYAGVCSNVARGLRFTFGYKGSFNAIASADNNCGPNDTIVPGGGADICSVRGRSGQWTCAGGPNNEGGPVGIDYVGSYTTLQELMDSHLCVAGSYAKRAITFPTCWDPTYVDTPDHRAHMSYGQTSILKCSASHPVAITAISLLTHYEIDSTFVAGKWHLSSDEMAACYDTGGLAGCTDHGDYWEAWSDSIRDTWYAKCNLGHNSCTNEVGDGTMYKYPTSGFGGTSTTIFGAPHQMNTFDSAENYGMSKNITANGTYTIYLHSVGDGVFGFLGMKNFSGSVDAISVTDLGAAAKGPVTVHN